MKSLYLFMILSAVSLAIMTIVDYIIGPKAEFLNAYSVLQRLFGKTPTFGDSMLATRFGSGGELLAVLIANLLIGGILTLMVRLLQKN